MATPHITGMGALLLAHHPVFREAARVRNEQRVAQLFSLLASAGVRYLGDPTREGVGVPDLQKVAGLTAQRTPGTVQTASVPIGSALGGAFGGVSPFSANFGQPGFQTSLLPFSNGFVPNAGINPAILQGLLQMRSAGLI
jgi:hypothetical protein